MTKPNHHPRLPSTGLYAITDTRQTGTQLIDAVEQAILGGARLIQYRNKNTDAAVRHTEASALLACCQIYHIPLLINDDVTLAARIGAAGVHLGRDDASVAEARQLLGPDAIIGVSCYNDWALAQRYATQADYLAFGRFFPSNTKPQATLASLDILQKAQQIPLPIVAIGGINAHNGQALINAGADLLAVIDGVFGAADQRQTAQQLSQLFPSE